MDASEWFLTEGAAYQALPPEQPGSLWVVHLHLHRPDGTVEKKALAGGSEADGLRRARHAIDMDRGSTHQPVTCQNCGHGWMVRIDLKVTEEGCYFPDPSDQQMVCPGCDKYADRDHGPNE